jgi:hypothetical protein
MELGAVTRVAWSVRAAATIERPTHQRRTDDLEELFDFVLTFFTVCYHLQDWLLQDDPSIQPALDELFSTSKPLRLSADIANIAKHFDSTRPPRAGRQLSFAREYVPGGMGWFGRDGRLLVLSDGEKSDVLDLAAERERRRGRRS